MATFRRSLLARPLYGWELACFWSPGEPVLAQHAPRQVPRSRYRPAASNQRGNQPEDRHTTVLEESVNVFQSLVDDPQPV
jgi:hypothetical protein